MRGEEPVSTKWLQNTTPKWFKKRQNWKNLVATLINIQALLTGENMGEENGSKSKFNSIPFYELCLKINTCSVNEVFLMRMRVNVLILNFNKFTW